ncbi:MAG: hypothetical protein JWM99_2272 [Verrucomicrobiales bacterium]|nr:hypothetical protein [Verrucomicrobiales bacterium]
MKSLVLYFILGVLGFVTLLIWLSSHVHYRIGSKHLKVLLFGICVRRIALDEIRDLSKRDPGRFAERWYNTFHLSHRLLVVKRTKGLRKNFVITPSHRYVFMADLQTAVDRVKRRQARAESSQSSTG